MKRNSTENIWKCKDKGLIMQRCLETIWRDKQSIDDSKKSLEEEIINKRTGIKRRWKKIAGPNMCLARDYKRWRGKSPSSKWLIEGLPLQTDKTEKDLNDTKL